MVSKVPTLMAKFLTDISSLWLFAMLILIGCDIFMRYAFNYPIPGTLEISEQTVVIVTFLCLAYTGIQDRHIRTTAIVGRLPARFQFLSDFLAMTLMLILLSLLFWRTSAEAWRSFSIREIRMGLIEVPMYPTKMAIPIGIFVAWLCYFSSFLKLFRKRGRRER